MKNFLFLFCFFFATPLIVFGQSDKTLVEEACYDYIDTFYKADTNLAYRSIHASLKKRGFYFNQEKNEFSAQLEMSFADLIKLANKWNADGKKVNKDSIRKVDVFEISDKTASAKVTAVWGIDYIHLYKEKDKWYVVNVLWQSPPNNN